MNSVKPTLLMAMGQSFYIECFKGVLRILINPWMNLRKSFVLMQLRTLFYNAEECFRYWFEF